MKRKRWTSHEIGEAFQAVAYWLCIACGVVIVMAFTAGIVGAVIMLWRDLL